MTDETFETVGDWIKFRAAVRPGATAVGGMDEARPLSFQELADFLDATARQLNSWGIGPGDVVLLALPDGPMALTAFLSVAWTATAFPVAAQEQPEEYDRILDEIEVRAVMMTARPNAPLTQRANERGITLIRVSPQQGAPEGTFDMEASADDRALCMMPIAHMHSLVRSSLPVLFSGGEAIWARGFDRDSALGWIDTFTPTYLSAVPTIYRSMLVSCL